MYRNQEVWDKLGMVLEEIPGRKYEKVEGAWTVEPDKAVWVDQETDLDCMIVRNGGGALCGYVGVPKGHELFGEEYQDLYLSMYVHGGLTYSSACAGHVCHPHKQGRPKEVWWFGFDCSHASDFNPQDLEGGIYYSSPEKIKSYKIFEYVVGETQELAAEIVAEERRREIHEVC